MGGRDPCKGLRRQLAAHRRTLREFQDDPFAHDNAGVPARSRTKSAKDESASYRDRSTASRGSSSDA
jgi:hypothetical protein